MNDRALTHLDLFSGIGGFALGFRMAGGIKTAAFCENDRFCHSVLAKNFRGIKIYDDIKTLTADKLKAGGIPKIDIITAGFPCQDISTAKSHLLRHGLAGKESGLFYEACRLVDEIKPRYFLLENVSAILTGGNGEWFRAMLAAIANLRRNAEWANIPATALGAPHKRSRLWLISTRQDERLGGIPMADPPSKRHRKSNRAISRQGGHKDIGGGGVIQRVIDGLPSRAWKAPWSEWRLRPGKDNSKRKIPIEPRLCISPDGLPDWLVGRSRKCGRAIGNSIVPQIAQALGEAIVAHAVPQPP